MAEHLPSKQAMGVRFSSPAIWQQTNANDVLDAFKKNRLLSLARKEKRIINLIVDSAKLTTRGSITKETSLRTLSPTRDVDCV
jgi:hypothetical protein